MNPAIQQSINPSQADIIIAVLAAHPGEYVSMVDLWRVSGAFAVHSRVADLRRRGHVIANKIELLPDGTRASYYALVPKTATLRVVCAWCNKVLQDGAEPASHGICEDCAKVHFPNPNNPPIQ